MPSEPTDRAVLAWLNEQVVDVIHLDDGRIIDVAGGDVRDAIIKAMKRQESEANNAE